MLTLTVTGQASKVTTPVIGEEILAEVTDIQKIKGDVVKLQARKGGAA